MVSEYLAELWGMHAGDGTLYRTSTGSVVFELRGNHEERSFYEGYVVALLLRVFTHPWQVNDRSGGKNGCMGLRCCKKDFAELILAGGFPVGKKTRTVRMPAGLSDPASLAAFLRGLFATDGCVHLAKINGKTVADYPTIEFTSASEVLVDQVRYALESFGIGCHTWQDCPQAGGSSMKLRIAGKARCRRFVERIGIPNPTHLRRIAGYL